MAQATAIKTYDVSTNVRDVTDLISVVAPTEVPFYNALSKVKATGKFHEAQYYDLTTGSANAQIEGGDYTLSKGAVPSTAGNYTQIFYKNAKVSKTQQAVQTYGIDDMMAQQIKWRLQEIATDIEKALLQGTGNSGASGTAREMYGALALITTNVETGTGTGAEALTEDMFNDVLQTIYDAGGRPKDVFVNSFQKRKISAFTASSTKNVDAADKMLVNSVNVYESDFGVLTVHLDSFMATDKVLVAQKDLWAVAMLRPMIVEDYPSGGSYVAKTIEGELTLESRNEKGSGSITGLSTS
jgi:hypothetical protein